MAARLRPKHQAEVRSKIKALQLVNFVQTYALTGMDTGKQEVNPARIQAARILLDKTIPSLTGVALSSDPQNPVRFVIDK